MSILAGVAATARVSSSAIEIMSLNTCFLSWLQSMFFGILDEENGVLRLQKHGIASHLLWSLSRFHEQAGTAGDWNINTNNFTWIALENVDVKPFVRLQNFLEGLYNGLIAEQYDHFFLGRVLPQIVPQQKFSNDGNTVYDVRNALDDHAAGINDVDMLCDKGILQRVTSDKGIIVLDPLTKFVLGFSHQSQEGHHEDTLQSLENCRILRTFDYDIKCEIFKAKSPCSTPLCDIEKQLLLNAVSSVLMRIPEAVVSLGKRECRQVKYFLKEYGYYENCPSLQHNAGAKKYLVSVFTSFFAKNRTPDYEMIQSQLRRKWALELSKKQMYNLYYGWKRRNIWENY